MVGSQINVAGTLDYNATSTYTLTIQASDSTTTDEATVMINLYTSNILFIHVAFLYINLYYHVSCNKKDFYRENLQ